MIRLESKPCSTFSQFNMKALTFLYLNIPFIFGFGVQEHDSDIEVTYLKILKQSEHCQKPERDDVITMHYSAKLPDGTIVTPYTEYSKFQMGSKNVILGVAKVVSDMCIGEKLVATLPSYLAYGTVMN